MITTPPPVRSVALLALALLAPAALPAQAQFAGTYIGTLNTKVTVPVVGSIENGVGAYSATGESLGEVYDVP